MVLLILILLGCHFSYKIAYFPQAGGDEHNIISFDCRYASLGERLDLTWISECYNQRGLPKLPPPWTSRLRSLYHGSVGCSSFSGRVFSLFLVLSSLLITAVVWPLRHGLSPRIALILLLAGGLSPSLYFAARTVRFEQEILFLGCLSLLLIPCLLLRRLSPAVNRLIWATVGCLSGYVGACHPLGYVFVGVQLVSLSCLARAWKERDGLSSGRRLLAWSCGLAVPIAMQAAFYAWDWPNWRAYITDTSLRFVEVKKILVDTWAPQGPFGLGSTLPWLSAALHSFKLASVSPFMSCEGSPLLSGFFIFQAIMVVAASLGLLVHCRRCNTADLPLTIVVWLAGAFVFAHFAYALFFSPNYTAYPYLGLFVPVGFTWLTIRSVPWLRENFSGRISCWVVAPLFALLFYMMLSTAFAVRQSLWVARAFSQGDLSSFDDHIKIMAQTGRKLRWADDPTPVYFDNYTWPAAGPNWKSLFEVSFNEKRRPASWSDRVSFSTGLYNQVFNYANWGVQTTSEQRLERIRELFRNKSVSALVFDRTDQYQFWEARATEDDASFWAGRMVAPGNLLWARASLPGVPLEFHEGKVSQDEFNEGWYIVLMKSSTAGSSCYRMKLSSEGGGNPYEARDCCIGPIHTVVPMPLLIHISRPGTRIMIEPNGTAVSEEARAQITPVSEWSAQ